MERLQKVIANAGYCSRRKAEELIKAGKVAVNDKVITELGTKVSGKEKIVVEGVALEKDELVYYMLHKPVGVISTTNDEKKRKCVTDIIDTDIRIYPVGRLDYDASGLLLLTNDGDLTNRLLHPSNEVPKLYLVKVEGIVTGSDIIKMKQGVVIDGMKCIPDRVKLKRVNKKSKTSVLEITIHDGKNHEVKKLCANVGKKVIKLQRLTFGILTIGGLNSGEYRRLTPKEVKVLYNEYKSGN